MAAMVHTDAYFAAMAAWAREHGQDPDRIRQSGWEVHDTATGPVVRWQVLEVGSTGRPKMDPVTHDFTVAEVVETPMLRPPPHPFPDPPPAGAPTLTFHLPEPLTLTAGPHEVYAVTELEQLVKLGTVEVGRSGECTFTPLAGTT